jgi:hypothetical protein
MTRGLRRSETEDGRKLDEKVKNTKCSDARLFVRCILRRAPAADVGNLTEKAWFATSVKPRARNLSPMVLLLAKLCSMPSEMVAL